MVNPGMFSSLTVEWRTPRVIYAQLDVEFDFTLDPCPGPDAAPGLMLDWRGHRVFLNPPYGRGFGVWVKKAWESAEAGALVVGLFPSRTDTGWWHDYCLRASEIRFLRGRLCFNDDPKRRAPFPSCVVIFRPDAPLLNGAPTVRVEGGER